MNSKALLKILESKGLLENPQIKKAFYKIDRKDFVLSAFESYAYQDEPINIGYGQTISQPSTVAFMLNLLEPTSSNKILDIGSGSGWTSVLLASIVGAKGKIIGLELIPELVEFSLNNISKYTFRNIEIKQSDEKALGIARLKFDRILVSAAANEIPEELIDQLSIGGIMVIPVKNSVWKIQKLKNQILKKEYYGFRFVPLVIRPISLT